MLKIIILSFINFSALIAMILIFICNANPLFALIPFFIIGLGVIIEAVCFSRYTNKIHDRNAHISKKCPFEKKSSKGEKNFYVEKVNGYWTMQLANEESVFDLKGYHLQKSFIIAYFIRWIYYRWFDKSQKLRRFFRSSRINCRVNIFLHFIDGRKKTTVCLATNGRVKVSFLTQWILYSKFYLCWFDRNNKQMRTPVGRFQLDEDWYLHGFCR